MLNKYIGRKALSLSLYPLSSKEQNDKKKKKKNSVFKFLYLFFNLVKEGIFHTPSYWY